MVNETALEKIKKFLLSQNIGIMKKWSERKHYDLHTRQILRYVRQKINDIRHVFNIISGNDIFEMLKGTENHFLYQIILLFSILKRFI